MSEGSITSMAIKQTGLELQAVPCPLCDAWGGTRWGFENGFEALKCDACGFVYVSPRPADAEISEATQTGQHRHESGEMSVVYKPSKRKLARYRRRIKRVLGSQLGKRPVSWLDIGAGFGELVEALDSLLPAGSTADGIEPMEPKAKHAAARGLSVSSAPLHTVQERFDYVSLINIFSHVAYPREFLKQVVARVSPGGTLVLVTGNGGDLASAKDYPDRLDLPDHLTFAGQRHISSALAAVGFEVYRVDAQRLDTAAWTVKAIIKRAMGTKMPLTLPYTSPFRDVLYLARAVS